MTTRTRIRRATSEDLAAIVQLLADDPLGASREANRSPLSRDYYEAFAHIDRDANNELVVVEAQGKEKGQTIVGVLQITFIPGITYQGGWRALIEGVRVAASFRSSGIGKALFLWAIERAKERGCHMLQLTTDKTRADAIRFYESLGFAATHEGMKLHLAIGAADSSTTTRA